jgi:hypothetical protein
MDAPEVAVRVAAFGLIAALVAVSVLTVTDEGALAAFPVTEADGSAFAVPHEEGAYSAIWRDFPVMVFVVEPSALQAAAAAHGDSAVSRSVPTPDGHRLFVLSAKSTFHGCTVAPHPSAGLDLDADGDIEPLLIDPCRQVLWDPLLAGASASEHFGLMPLAALDARLEGDRIVATAFDGPVGAQVDQAD